MSRRQSRIQQRQQEIHTLSPPEVQPPASNVSSNSPATARQRQARRDEAIRKKYELELKKKPGNPGTSMNRSSSSTRANRRNDAFPPHQRIPGTVAALRPTQAVTVRESLSVVEASQLMAAKRADSVLVVDEDEHLAGIFTAKDLAYRVIAQGLDANSTTVKEIMTRNPFCVTGDTPATDALTTMVQRHFRHLPVCNEEGDVVGLLDITKCMYEALEKMERAYTSSKKLYEAMEGVEKEWAGVQPVAFLQFIEVLRERMSFPDLASVLDHDTEPAEVGVKNSVRDAACIMKDRRVTAVVVMEHGQISGIFTSKDIVLRCVAAGLNPDSCSVVRVMTPHPDTAPPSMTIVDALRKMHDGRFLNLPVVDEETRSVLGVVDVLRLTYIILEQINSITNSDVAKMGMANNVDPEGPMWNRFFSFGQGEAESIVSGSVAASIPLSVRQGRYHMGEDLDVLPNESASAIGSKLMHGNTAVGSYDDGRFAFKFKDPRNESITHRFVITEHENIDSLRQVVYAKLGLDKSKGETKGISICYVDDEGDKVVLANDGDILEAVICARKGGFDRVQLIITGLKPTVTITLPPPVTEASVAPSTPPPPPSQQHLHHFAEVHSENASMVGSTISKRRSRHKARQVRVDVSSSEESSEPVVVERRKHDRKKKSIISQEVLLGAAVGLSIVVVGLLVVMLKPSSRY